MSDKHELVAREIAELIWGADVLDGPSGTRLETIAAYQAILERAFPCTETTGFHMPVIDESLVLRDYDDE